MAPPLAISGFEEAVRNTVEAIIPAVEAIGAAIIIVGVAVSSVVYLLSELRIRPVPYEHVRLLLGRFLALGLEFQLAADILTTAVAPSFEDIGKLGAIAAIRTFLNYFLAKEIEKAAEMEKEGMLMSPESMPGGRDEAAHG